MVENEILNSLGMGGDPTAMVASATGSITTVIMIILISAVLIGIFWFALWFNSFKIHVIIREATHKRRYITSDKAKIKNLDGVEYYYLRSRRVYLNIPPVEALEITRKGRYFCEAYHDGEAGKNTGYKWITDITDDLLSVSKGKDKEEDDSSIVDPFKPLSTQRQSALVNRIRRAEARKGKSLLENIMPIVQTMAIVIMVISIFLFYGELTKANTNAMEMTSKITNMRAKMTEELNNGLGVLTGKLSRDELVFVQDIPMDQQIPPELVIE